MSENFTEVLLRVQVPDFDSNVPVLPPLPPPSVQSNQVLAFHIVSHYQHCVVYLPSAVIGLEHSSGVVLEHLVRVHHYYDRPVLQRLDEGNLVEYRIHLHLAEKLRRVFFSPALLLNAFVQVVAFIRHSNSFDVLQGS